MTVSDFPKAVARLSEGFCPLCDVDLRDHKENQAHARPRETVKTIADELGDVTGCVVCFRCRQGWRMEEIAGRTVLATSRPLRKEEIRRLYDRSEGAST